MKIKSLKAIGKNQAFYRASLALFTGKKTALAVPLTNRSRRANIIEPPGYGWKEVDEILSCTYSQKFSIELFDFSTQSASTSLQSNPYTNLRSNLERFNSGVIAFNRAFLTEENFFFDPNYQNESLAAADLFLRTRLRGFSCELIRNLYCYQSFSSQNSRSTTNEPSAEQKLFSERWNTVISDPSSAASVPPCRAIEFRPIRSLV